MKYLDTIRANQCVRYTGNLQVSHIEKGADLQLSNGRLWVTGSVADNVTISITHPEYVRSYAHHQGKIKPSTCSSVIIDGVQATFIGAVGKNVQIKTIGHVVFLNTLAQGSQVTSLFGHIYGKHFKKGTRIKTQKGRITGGLLNGSAHSISGDVTFKKILAHAQIHSVNGHISAHSAHPNSKIQTLKGLITLINPSRAQTITQISNICLPPKGPTLSLASKRINAHVDSYLWSIKQRPSFSQRLKELKEKFSHTSVSMENVPSEFFCPLSKSIMDFPVKLHGHFFALSSLLSLKSDILGKRINPILNSNHPDEKFDLNDIQPARDFEFLAHTYFNQQIKKLSAPSLEQLNSTRKPNKQKNSPS